jgi:nucleoside-diphosphate-sugar epimerase
VPAVADERHGDLADALALAAAITADIDVIVHAGQLTGDQDADLATIAVLAGAAQKAVYVSGVWVLGETGGADEDSPANPIPLVAYRDKVERLVIDGGGSVVRPGVVHGRGTGIVALLRDQAAQRGTGVYVTAGGAVPTWTFVHVEDLAELIVTIVEKGEPTVYHAISEEAVPVTTVAEAAARSAGVKETAEPWPVGEAAQLLGEGFAQALAISQRVSAVRTRQALGWNPVRPGVVADLGSGSYAG